MCRGICIGESASLAHVKIADFRYTHDLEGLSRLCTDPFSVDVGLLLEQRLIVELLCTIVISQCFFENSLREQVPQIKLSRSLVRSRGSWNIRAERCDPLWYILLGVVYVEGFANKMKVMFSRWQRTETSLKHLKHLKAPAIFRSHLILFQPYECGVKIPLAGVCTVCTFCGGFSCSSPTL